MIPRNLLLATIVLLNNASLLKAADLPAGKGRDILTSACSMCHPAELVSNLNRSREEWVATIERMKAKGAPIQDADAKELAGYLATHCGPAKAAGSATANSSAAPKPAGATPAKAVRTPRALPWDTKHLAEGLALYRANCIICHDIAQVSSKKLGPNFYHLFKKDKMPGSGVPTSRAYIGVRIKLGGQVMPAFAKKLSAAQIETLIDYIAAN